MSPADALFQFRAGELSREALAGTVYPLLRRLAKATAWKVGGVDADDLAQELWLTFEKSVLYNYEPGVALEPYLLVIARHAAFQMRSKVRETAESDLTDSSSPEQDDRHMPFVTDEGLVSDIDRCIGILEVRHRLYNVVMNNSETESKQKQVMPSMVLPYAKEAAIDVQEGARLPDVEKQSRTPRVHRPIAQELVDIRKSLGMTHAEFAEALGIGMPRLSSYIYGDTTVPDWVVNLAREMAENGGNALDSARMKYESVPMSKILAGWAEELGVPYENSQELASLLGASKATVTRWKNDLIHPRLSSVLRYEQMVKEAKKKLAKQSKFVEQRAVGKVRPR
ncbi:MAG: hypothetical protein HZB71_05740 [Betaproteobacteria bacterium]|nr:hypothetical protein [Betaproteobacteria bacterium]